MNGTGSRTGDRPRGHRPYPHEVLTAGYLAVTGALGAILGHPAGIWPTVLAHTIGIIVILFVLPRLLSTGYHDRTIQSVEMALFHAPPGAALRHVLPWWPVDEYLHFTYVAYYALLPLLGGALYFTGRRR